MSLVKTSPSSSSSSESRLTTVIWIVAAGLAVIFGGILLATLTPLILPPAASAEASQVDGLFRFMFAIGGAIFLLVVGVLGFAIVRFRARPGDISDGVPMGGNTTLELVWTVIPAIIVAVITIYAYQVWISTTTLHSNEVRVGAVGQRYAWAFNYAITSASLPREAVEAIEDVPAAVRVRLDNGDTIPFSNQRLHTWVGQPTRVVMTTQDVNHAFWVPAMRIKQDLLAGRETTIGFTPTEPGVYRIICAELCGAGHGNMAGEVAADGTLLGAWLVVHPDEETYLREFFEPEALKVLFPPEDPVALGRQILASGQYPCATCHVLTDLGWVGNIGPNLNGIGNRAAQRVPGQTAEDYLIASIRYPGEYLVSGYGNLMPAFNPEPTQPNYMPDDDLDAIVAYLLSLR